MFCIFPFGKICVFVLISASLCPLTPSSVKGKCPEFGASRLEIPLRLLFPRKNGAPRQDRASPLFLLPGAKTMFDDTILQRVIGDDHDNTSLRRQSRKSRQHGLELSQLVVDKDPKSLKDAPPDNGALPTQKAPAETKRPRQENSFLSPGPCRLSS